VLSEVLTSVKRVVKAVKSRGADSMRTWIDDSSLEVVWAAVLTVVATVC